MCIRLGSCFGSGQDYGRSTSKATHDGGADHKSGPQAYNKQPATDDEAARNAGAGVRKDYVDDAGGHGGYYVQDKPVGDAPKQPAAWSGKVGGDAAVDYHHYPATTATTLASRPLRC